ncbi:MAG: DNA-binding response regulator, partial [Spirochaetaceae bacterium]
MIRIGIADDEDLVRDGIAALLSHQQGMIVVSTVSTAHEAVDLAGSGAIDVLLLDL